ncbi:M56 family metallopeptidase [Daejeonella lutea]|nr:M56 family metallopeptidase [Daejeonella lutea]
MLLYLLKVNIALLFFYAGYHLILQRYTFHTLNRFYLLTGLLYSALYPLINVSGLLSRNEHLKDKINLLTPDWQGSVTYVINRAENSAGNYWQLLLMVFWTGVIFMSLRLTIQLISLLVLHIRSTSMEMGSFKFRKITKAINPFSFWRTIYLNPECHEESELHSILEHEQVHVRQLHTLDVMLAELSTIFYWFNPGVWLMKKAIKANLEFITDQEVIRSGIDAKEYQYTLLRSHVLPQHSMPVNNFHFLTIKKRIAMINKKPSNRINQSNYLLLVPAIMILVLITGISKADFTGHVTETFKALPQLSSIDLIRQKTTVSQSKPAGKIKAKYTELKTNLNSSTITNTAFDTNKIVKGVVVVTGKPLNSSMGRTLIELDTTVSGRPLYVLDGKPQINGIGHLASERIESIKVLKGENATKLYGEKGKDGVIEIETKAFGVGKSNGSLKPVTVVGYSLNQNQKISLSDIDNEMIILDGKEITKERLDDIKVTTIGTIEIFKGSSAVSKYGEKAKDGVIVITTK